jgi:hypothetical protein
MRPQLSLSPPAAGDHMLVSVGSAGAVYFWELRSGCRLQALEYVDKKCSYCAVQHLHSGQGGWTQAAAPR